jgi:hypothetical protein
MIKHKCGDLREDGMKFWHYAKASPNGEYWATVEQWQALRDANNARQRKAYREKAGEKEKKNKRRAEDRRKQMEDPRERAKFNRYFLDYVKERKRVDPAFKMKVTLRNRLKNSLRKSKRGKKVKTSKALGCSWSYFVKYMETRFSDGMTWGNHGEIWEVDHIKPLASYDLVKKIEQEKACHYLNLQPMLKEENRAKGDKELKQCDLDMC